MGGPQSIKSHLKGKARPAASKSTTSMLVNLEFSESFQRRDPRTKSRAEQSALAAKNKLEQIKFEGRPAHRRRGTAEAIRIEGPTLREQSPGPGSPSAIENGWTHRPYPAVLTPLT